MTKGARKQNEWGGMGMMILDALDTAMMMGLDGDEKVWRLDLDITKF